MASWIEVKERIEMKWKQFPTKNFFHYGQRKFFFFFPENFLRKKFLQLFIFNQLRGVVIFSIEFFFFFWECILGKNKENFRVFFSSSYWRIVIKKFNSFDFSRILKILSAFFFLNFGIFDEDCLQWKTQKSWEVKSQGCVKRLKIPRGKVFLVLLS